MEKPSLKPGGHGEVFSSALQFPAGWPALRLLSEEEETMTNSE